MIYLELFLTFFKIGLFTIGGGYAMIPMIEDDVISKGWINESQLTNFLAISESTPGPFAVNMTTFVGFDQAGILGAFCSTLGVILPSFIIILIIAKVINGFLKNKYVEYALKGVRPVVVGLILSVGFSLVYSAVLNKQLSLQSISFASIIIMIISFIMLRFKKTNSPILIILVSAVFGIVFFGLIGGF